ncbi:hypothetical protein [Mucilaginibacter sp. NFX135]|uniref:hypothetical protein n=1 Tax=Mucilaginibacter sp. NFX135 TaxID=3402687 RepID=UPI003AFB1FB9
METGKDVSSHLFTLNYAERELSCLVERRGNRLDVLIDNNIAAVLQITDHHGTVEQVSGDELSESVINFIKKEVIEKVNDTENSR